MTTPPGLGGPNAAVLLHLQRLASQFETECRWHGDKLRTARTMRDVKQLCDVHLRGELRGMPGARHVMSQLHQAGERKMEEMLKTQLEALGAIMSSHEFREKRAQHIARDWVFLRGEFSRVYGLADRESNRMLHLLYRLEQQPPTLPEVAAAEPTAPPPEPRKPRP